MTREHLYRSLTYQAWTEDEMWQRLDGALSAALQDPDLAWLLAHDVLRDSGDFPCVQVAATSLMSELTSPLWTTSPK